MVVVVAVVTPAHDYDGPVYASPFLGAAADWLCLVGGLRATGGKRPSLALTPLCSWMGGKRDEAADILALLGLRPGHPIPAILGDASWWGWVWPVVLDAVAGPRVSEVLRSWRGEDPRALWFRLRDLGPIADDLPAAAAQLLWLQARAASGVPVWWEGAEWEGNGYNYGQRVRDERKAAEREYSTAGQTALLVAPGDGRGRQVAHERSAPDPRLLASDGRGDPRETGQRTVRSERLIATTRGGQDPGAPFEAGHKGTDTRGGGGIIDPGTIADRADAIRSRLVKASGGEAGFGDDDGVRRGKGWRLFEPGDVRPLVLHTGARELTEEWAPRLGAGGRWYFDPPYRGKTGYPVTCPRDEVLAIVEIPARHGAPVVVSEGEGLAADLGAGWTQIQLSGGPKPEWVTVYNCDARALLPPLLRRIG